MQRKYPQIYKTADRLLINPEEIDVIARDFIISAKRMGYDTLLLVTVLIYLTLHRSHPVYCKVNIHPCCAYSFTLATPVARQLRQGSCISIESFTGSQEDQHSRRSRVRAVG